MTQAITGLSGNDLPIGMIIPFDKTFPNTPTVSGNWKECDGTAISDSNSPFDGYRIRNLNGASVVLTLTWASGVATVSATDVTALSVGDTVAGSTIAAGAYIDDITGTTVTMTDTAFSGSGVSTTFSNGGKFPRGGLSSGTGQKDQMQQITGVFGSGNGNSSSRSINGTGTGAITLTTTGVSNIFNNVAVSTTGVTGFTFDSADSTAEGGARTGAETRPENMAVVYIMRIK